MIIMRFICEKVLTVWTPDVRNKYKLDIVFEVTFYYYYFSNELGMG